MALPPRVWEITNPDNRCHFEAPDAQLAALVVGTLGQGAYGAVPLEAMAGEPDVQASRFTAFWARHWPEESPQACGDRRRDELIAAFRSLAYGDRQAFVELQVELAAQDGSEAADRHRDRWNAQHFRGGDDVCGRARMMAGFLVERRPTSPSVEGADPCPL